MSYASLNFNQLISRLYSTVGMSNTGVQSASLSLNYNAGSYTFHVQSEPDTFFKSSVYLTLFGQPYNCVDAVFTLGLVYPNSYRSFDRCVQNFMQIGSVIKRDKQSNSLSPL